MHFTPDRRSHRGSPLRLHFTSLHYDAMPLLRRLPPVPTTTATLSHHHVHLVTPHSPLRAPPSSLRLARLRIRPAASIRPLRAIPSTRCHAAGDLAPSPVPDGGSARAALLRIGEALSLGFPVWVGSACALALWRPASFLWVSSTAQMIGLMLTMLGT
jgi:BASS family bile acid:Na+ symporter